ncbi:EamA family transporter [Pseudolysinimonas kribbensis]|uniref:EamA family transporter n=2 Tax=Pseudolysinimonas kribbensis TaxID=433641 RepID=UPI0031E3C565
MPPDVSARARIGAGMLVLGELIVQDGGAAIAVRIFPSVGVFGVIALRVAFSALVLLLVARPRPPRRLAEWGVIAGFGLVIAVMNTSFYLAAARIPLATTVTIEVLGPLVLSVVMARRPIAWLWAGLGVAGVVLLWGLDLHRLDPLGVAFAAVSALSWAAYILASAESGRRFPRPLDGLAWAMAIAAVLTLPAGIATAGARIVLPVNLGLGLLVAVLSSAIPYGVEQVALRRLHPSPFGVLMSMSPGIAAGVGFVILAQALTIADAIAIVLVVAASVGAVLTAPRRRPAIAEPVA